MVLKGRGGATNRSNHTFVIWSPVTKKQKIPQKCSHVQRDDFPYLTVTPSPALAASLQLMSLDNSVNSSASIVGPPKFNQLRIGQFPP
ncbi:hypothetical protein AFLA_000624 [Aspergillus flavus NRRL3357]|nr:hypothetical protein AFLA_000624 [Aspergillus flavus NRRL3357]